MKITKEQWDQLSNMMVKETRELNKHQTWQAYTTSYWRMKSNSILLEIFNILGGVEIDDNEKEEK